MSIETVSSRKKCYVKPGEVFVSENPYSEVCMHLRVSGCLQAKYITPGQYPMVQLLKIEQDGSVMEHSSRITLGEGGVYRDSGGYYYIPTLAFPSPLGPDRYYGGSVWFFYDETGDRVGPFDTREQAEEERLTYVGKLKAELIEATSNV